MGDRDNSNSHAARQDQDQRPASTDRTKDERITAVFARLLTRNNRRSASPPPASSSPTQQPVTRSRAYTIAAVERLHRKEEKEEGGKGEGDKADKKRVLSDFDCGQILDAADIAPTNMFRR